MSKDGPSQPDFTGAAQATADSSRAAGEAQTWANRPGINTPFGQQTWDVTPQWDPTTNQYVNSWTQNTNLTPEAQQALDSQMRVTQGRSDIAEGLVGQAADQFSNPVDWDSFSPMASTPQGGAMPDVPQYNAENIQRSIGDAGKYNQDAISALNEQFDSRQEPRLQREAAARKTELYNQGLKEGDEAYDNAMSDLDQSQQDTRRQADLDAILTGGQEAQRYQGMDATAGNFANSASQQSLAQQLGIGAQGFQQDMSKQGTQYDQASQSANFQNQTRQQQIAETLQQRGLGINEINAILNGQQVGMPTMPGFNAAGRSAPTDYSGAANSQYGANLDAYNTQQQNNQGLYSGILNAAMMFGNGS